MRVTPEFTLRPLKIADALAAAAVIRAAFAALSAAVDPPPSALRETGESVAQTLAAGGGAGAEAASGLAGVVLWEAKDGGLYVGRLSVLPAWRGRGIASALMAAAEAEARRRGLPRLHLATRLALADNRRLFAACGFRETAQRAHSGYSAPTFVEMEKMLA